MAYHGNCTEFPKTCCNNFENVMLSGIIPANNKEEPKSVDPYVEVLVDELLGLCETLFYENRNLFFDWNCITMSLTIQD